MMRRACWTLAVMLLFSWPVAAQDATMNGVVTDESGAVLPGAAVTATSRSTGRLFEVVTNERGEYRLVGLPPGRYDMKVELAGFSIVVVSDGRLDRQADAAGAAAVVREALGGLSVPVHVVPVAAKSPPDATVRAVRVAGAAVAHQAFDLRVEVGCHGGLACTDVPVVVRELRDQGDPQLLAKGVAKVEGETGTVALPLMLHRTGARVI